MRFGLFAVALIGAIMSIETQAISLAADPPAPAAAAKPAVDSTAIPAGALCRNCCPDVKCGKCPCPGAESLEKRVTDTVAAMKADCTEAGKCIADPTEASGHKCAKKPDADDKAPTIAEFKDKAAVPA